MLQGGRVLFILYLFLVLGSQPLMLRSYSSIRTQELLPVVLWGAFGIPEIHLGQPHAKHTTPALSFISGFMFSGHSQLGAQVTLPY